jgi:hypothetical protein
MSDEPKYDPGTRYDASKTKRDLLKLERENEWYRAAHLLLAQYDAFAAAPEGSPFFYSVDVGVTTEGQASLSLNMGDTFAYACADCEEFSYEDAPMLLAIAKEQGWPGLVRWVAKRRGVEPLPEIVESMREEDERRTQKA